MQLHHLPERRGGDEPSGGVQQLSSDWPLQGGGDFNGDGKADVLYRDSSTARPSLVDPMNGTQVTGASSFTSSQVSNPNWQVAAAGDFDGDGAADILWRYDKASNAADPLRRSLHLGDERRERRLGVALESAGWPGQLACRRGQATSTATGRATSSGNRARRAA
jgi:hypothetical protein